MKELKLKIPKTQKVWVRYVKNNATTHIITSTLARDKYFLYEVNDDNTLSKISSGKQPVFKGFNDV